MISFEWLKGKYESGIIKSKTERVNLVTYKNFFFKSYGPSNISDFYFYYKSLFVLVKEILTCRKIKFHSDLKLQCSDLFLLDIGHVLITTTDQNNLEHNIEILVNSH